VISWIPISVALKKQFKAVIHFVGATVYVSISILAFSKERILRAFAIKAKVISVSNK
jgi:hypothetical protein